MTTAGEIQSDDKDWTWVLTQPCPDCGFDPAAQPAERLGELLRGAIPRWKAVLHRADAHARPAAEVWSPLEYGCHVVDVCVLFDERLRAMIARDGAEFSNWDQDETALAARYGEQDPSATAVRFAEAADTLADRFDAVQGELWEHRGVRSNGSEFTVRTFAQYFWHDIRHHLADVDG
ncbi:MAG: DinB family protein [Nakamurella sp.]